MFLLFDSSCHTTILPVLQSGIRANTAVWMKNLVSTYLDQMDIFILLESLENFAPIYLSVGKKRLRSMCQWKN